MMYFEVMYKIILAVIWNKINYINKIRQKGSFLTHKPLYTPIFKAGDPTTLLLITLLAEILTCYWPMANQ